MTDPLHLPAQPGAPIACDMTTAEDTADERLAEYRRLFARALVRTERDDRSLTFVLRDDPGVRENVKSLARRESACCPFLTFLVETSGGEVIYTITGDGRAGVDAMLDVMATLPEHAGSDVDGLIGRFAEHGVEVVGGDDRSILR